MDSRLDTDRPGRLRQILKYGRQTYRLDLLLGGMTDRRKKPRVSASLVARTMFLLGLLRIRSFNALEPRLAEAGMQRALGLDTSEDRVCSADTLAYGLRQADVPTYRRGVVSMVKRAERNKVFREGWHQTLRFVALDGWEPYSSRSRCCPACLTRQVTVGNEQVTEYYHRYVIAMLVSDLIEVVVDMEPVQSADVRIERGDRNVAGHEGEQTAAKRLLRRLKDTYGRWIDVVVGDALYSNGPFLTVAAQCGFGVIAVLKKEDNEPLKEALSLLHGAPPEKIVDDEVKKERVSLWDCPEIETLSSYSGPIRVVRAVVEKAAKPTASTWCFAVTGKATKLSARQVVQVGRGRWHLENTGFNQWTQHWHFSHVFTHGPDALQAIFWILFLAFNLLQLFAYRQLGGYGRARGSDPTRTLVRLIDEMLGDLERFSFPFEWNSS